jgi:sterol 3beta-glucosyltransferase
VGAPPVRDIGSMLSARLILVPVSPHVAAPGPRWPAHARVTGYWQTRAAEDWSPPGDLLDFLDAGDRPIAVSLGVMSLVGRQAEASARMTLAAIQQAGVRAIVQGWDQVLAGKALPDGVYRAGSLPHGWLFRQVSAVVHHGGFGTTASALSAGVPAVVVPHVLDQMYWAQRVYELGTGPKPVPRGALTARRLAAAIDAAARSPALRDRAAALGRDIQQEPDGVAAAVGLVEWGSLESPVEPALLRVA